MSERFRCERCGRSYAVSESLAGRSFRMRCKGCGGSITFRPRAAAPAPEALSAEEFEVVVDEPSPPAEHPDVPPLASRAPGRGEPLPPHGELAGAAPGAEARPRRRRGTGRALALAVALGAAGIAAGLLLLRGRAAPVAAPAA